jgi:hypothetical protein
MGIDKIVPVAYKNRNWQFYSLLNRGQIIFFNTRNGAPFMFHRKTGARIPLKPRAAWVTAQNLARIEKIPRKPTNTWNEYMKRATRIQRMIRGKPQRNQRWRTINANVARYTVGNKTALNPYSVPNLAWWAKSTNWMSANGAPYVKRGGQWHRYGGNRVTKNNILNNIQLMNNMRW